MCNCNSCGSSDRRRGRRRSSSCLGSICILVEAAAAAVVVAVYRGFPTRKVCLYYISCLRYTVLVGNP